MPEYIDNLTPNQTAVSPLGNSQRVRVVIPRSAGLVSADGSKSLDSDLTLTFFTTAIPVYADVDYIILEGGLLIEQLPEAAIYNMIFAASTLVDDMVLFDVGKHFPNHNTIAWRFFNRARTEFVKCRVLAELLRAIITARGTQAGRKALADFSIDNASLAGLLTQARPMLQDFVGCYQYWQRVLESGGAIDFNMPMPKSAVKAGNIPDSMGFGIGRSWIPTSDNLDFRSPEFQQGDAQSRPARFGRTPGFLGWYWWELR